MRIANPEKCVCVCVFVNSTNIREYNENSKRNRHENENKFVGSLVKIDYRRMPGEYKRIYNKAIVNSNENTKQKLSTLCGKNVDNFFADDSEAFGFGNNRNEIYFIIYEMKVQGSLSRSQCMPVMPVDKLWITLFYAAAILQ